MSFLFCSILHHTFLSLFSSLFPPSLLSSLLFPVSSFLDIIIRIGKTKIRYLIHGQKIAVPLSLSLSLSLYLSSLPPPLSLSPTLPPSLSSLLFPVSSFLDIIIRRGKQKYAI
uniref:Uncharacterized protein n=1 Tax=Cacopsylla melanoneura TaxID=428564 RepID=A0A8D9ER64_9HEMI